MARRSLTQREHDLAITSEQYLRGKTQMDIAAALGITQQQVSQDIKELRRRWREAGIRDINAAQEQELAKIDNLEVEYWRAWERSCAAAVTETKRQSKRGEADTKEQQIVTKDQIGDPRFLQGVQWCIERRCKILGFDAPVRQDVTSGGAALTFNVVYAEPSTED